MSNPCIEEQRAAIIYNVACPDCEDVLFEGTTDQIEVWAKKNGHDGYIDWDGIEDGYCCTLCDTCSWIVSNM